MAKVTEAVRKGRVCDGTSLALHKSRPARFKPFRPHPAHRGCTERAEQTVEASHGHCARGGERFGPEVWVIQIRARKPHDSL